MLSGPAQSRRMRQSNSPLCGYATAFGAFIAGTKFAGPQDTSSHHESLAIFSARLTTAGTTLEATPSVNNLWQQAAGEGFRYSLLRNNAAAGCDRLQLGKFCDTGIAAKRTRLPLPTTWLPRY